MNEEYSVEEVPENATDSSGALSSVLSGDSAPGAIPNPEQSLQVGTERLKMLSRLKEQMRIQAEARKAAMERLASAYESGPSTGMDPGLIALGRGLSSAPSGQALAGFTQGLQGMQEARQKLAERDWARQVAAQKIRAEAEQQNVTDLLNQARIDVAGTRQFKPFAPRDYVANGRHMRDTYDPNTGQWTSKDLGAAGAEKGWQLYTDGTDTFRANPNLQEGGFQKLTDAGWEASTPPSNLKKVGGGQQQSSSLNQRFAGRVIGAANEGLAALSTIAGMGDPNSGAFGIKNPTNIFTRMGAGVITPEQTKMYNATIAGLAVEIATAQNQGMVPHGDQIKHVEDAITILPTDSDQTKKYRVALAARYLDKALETSKDLANDKQSSSIERLRGNLKEFPDPNEILGLTPGKTMFKKETTSSANEPTDENVISKSPVQIFSDEDYDALDPGTVFIPPGGGKPRRKP